jgi:hypothetical protein
MKYIHKKILKKKEPDTSKNKISIYIRNTKKEMEKYQ